MIYGYFIPFLFDFKTKSQKVIRRQKIHYEPNYIHNSHSSTTSIKYVTGTNDGPKRIER